MGKKAKFTAALNAINTKTFRTIFGYGTFIALYLVFFSALLSGQDVDREENKNLLDILLYIYKSSSVKTILALTYLATGLIAVALHIFIKFSNIAILLFLNYPVIGIISILLCVAFVADLMVNAPSQQNNSPDQCDTLAHRFDFTKTVIAAIFGAIMKFKFKFDCRKH